MTRISEVLLDGKSVVLRGIIRGKSVVLSLSHSKDPKGTNLVICF